MGIEDYDPENEVDPVELQKEQVAMGREFLDRLRKKDAEDAERAKLVQSLSPRSAFPMPPPPTFEEISLDLKRAWAEVQKICPDAPDAIKAQAFQSLVYSTRSIGRV